MTYGDDNNCQIPIIGRGPCLGDEGARNDGKIGETTSVTTAAVLSRSQVSYAVQDNDLHEENKDKVLPTDMFRARHHQVSNEAEGLLRVDSDSCEASVGLVGSFPTAPDDLGQRFPTRGTAIVKPTKSVTNAIASKKRSRSPTVSLSSAGAEKVELELKRAHGLDTDENCFLSSGTDIASKTDSGTLMVPTVPITSRTVSESGTAATEAPMSKEHAVMVPHESFAEKAQQIVPENLSEKKEKLDVESLAAKLLSVRPSGVFDDANERTSTSTLEEIETHIKVQGAPQHALLAAPQQEPPGIFDDADEDDTFEIAAYKTAPSLPTASSFRPDLVAAILGSKLSLAPPALVQNGMAKKVSAKPKSYIEQDKKDSKRKKPIKPAKKVLTAKKEESIADKLFKGKVDLLQILPEDDCKFLGREMWIYTIQQLEYVLEGFGLAPSEEDGETGSFQISPSSFRDELVERLLHSGFLTGEYDPEQKTKRSLSNVTPSISSKPNDMGSDHKHAKIKTNDPYCPPLKAAENVVDHSRQKSQPHPITNDSAPETSDSNSEDGVIVNDITESRTSTQPIDGVTVIEDAQKLVQHPVTNSTAVGHAATKADATDDKGNPTMTKDHDAQLQTKVQSWTDAIRAWRLTSTVDENLVEKTRFVLTSSLAGFMPTCTQNFLESIKVMTAYDFLCLKRTETGMVVEMYRLWRKRCALSQIPSLTIAKHLLAVGARLEASIGSIPPADKETRAWVGGHMVVLTGSPKEFLFNDSKMFDADSFVERRTKELADMLIEWRISKKLPPLKGTGNVAMISGWKTLIKETKDLESCDGHVLQNIDLLKEAQDMAPKLPEEKKPKMEKLKPAKLKPAKKVPVKSISTKSSSPGQTSKTESAPARSDRMTSDFFLGTIFKADTIGLLDSVGIKTAEELLNADKRPISPLVSAIIKARSGAGAGGSMEPSSCVRLVYDWCYRVKRGLEEKKGASIDKTTKTRDVVLITTKEARDLTSLRKPPTDPFDAVSQTSKAFLDTMGISTAENFLAAKTTDIAKAFVEYREERNMPVLKGLGAVASVSGWKAMVRKAAKDHGQDNLVTLNAGRNSGIKLNRKAAETLMGGRIMPLAKSTIKEATDRTVLNGCPKKRFWVTGGENIFQFELTVRRSTLEQSKSALFLTYLGNSDNESETSNKHLSIGSSLPVMNHFHRPKAAVATGSLPFHTSLEGAGLLELRKYGVRPLPRTSGLRSIRRAIMAFVHRKSTVDEPESKGRAYNVFERRKNDSNEYYFCHQDAIEKGQSVELLFLPWGPPVYKRNEDCDEEMRHWIQIEVSSLPLKDLRDLLDFLNEEVGNNIYRKIHRLFDAGHTDAEKKLISMKVITDLVVSRRRMHWVALRINSQLQKEFVRSGTGSAIILPTVALAPLWTSDLVRRFRKFPEWAEIIRPVVVAETKQEVMTELKLSNFGQFWTCQASWCPIAKNLFEDAMDLLTNFSTELDAFCSDEEVLNRICSMVSQSVSKVRIIAELSEPDVNSLSDVALVYEEGSSHRSNALPLIDEVNPMLNRAYMDAMELCNEQGWKAPTGDELRLVATLPTIDGEVYKEKKILLQPIDKIKDPKTQIAVEWYVQRQILAVLETVALSGVANVLGASKLAEIRTKIQDAAKEASGGLDIKVFELEERPTQSQKFNLVEIPPALIPHGNISGVSCQPESEPFFLSNVWPVLKRAKWSLEAGGDPQDITYYPPGRKKDQRTRLLKQEAAKERVNIARKSTELGLGYIPKPAKKLFFRCATDGNDTAAPSAKPSACDVLRAFGASLSTRASDEDHSELGRIEKIVEYIGSLFDSVAPALLYDEESEPITLKDDQSWQDRLGCEYLMRLLLIMPNMLSQCDLSAQEMERTVGVVGELINYLVAHQESSFSSEFQLPKEEYGRETAFPDFLISRLKDAEAYGDLRGDAETITADLKEIVLPSDRSSLTDFVVVVMSQMIVCRATRDDTKRKGRRSIAAVGHPGLVCRHCLGQNGEGKYFYSNVASLSTAPTSVDKHIARCSKTSDTIREEMFAAKACHAEQQKNTPPGSQSAFFTRLWERLRQSHTSADTEADMHVTLSTAPSCDEMEVGEHKPSPSSKDALEFRDHVELLTYLQIHEPWKNMRELEDAISEYYGCLAWGGRLYNTNAMPKHFSAEWILSKISQEKRNLK